MSELSGEQPYILQGIENLSNRERKELFRNIGRFGLSLRPLSPEESTFIEESEVKRPTFEDATMVSMDELVALTESSDAIRNKAGITRVITYLTYALKDGLESVPLEQRTEDATVFSLGLPIRFTDLSLNTVSPNEEDPIYETVIFEDGTINWESISALRTYYNPPSIKRWLNPDHELLLDISAFDLSKKQPPITWGLGEKSIEFLQDAALFYGENDTLEEA